MLGEIFWASLLIIFGFSMLLGTLFGINIPIFRILAGIFLIYLGIQLIANWPAGKERATQSIYFGKRHITLDSSAPQPGKTIRYAVLFGAADIDLSRVTDALENIQPLEIEVNTVFSITNIKFNKDIPAKIISSTAFGKTEFPDDTDINFGTYIYRTQEDEKPHLILRTNTAFGKLDIEAK